MRKKAFFLVQKFSKKNPKRMSWFIFTKIRLWRRTFFKKVVFIVFKKSSENLFGQLKKRSSNFLKHLKIFPLEKNLDARLVGAT